MMESVSSFLVGLGIYLLFGGWYLFVFDLFGFRSRVTALEHFRGKKRYPVFCAAAMAGWFFIILFGLAAAFGLCGF